MYQYSDEELSKYEISQRQREQNAILWICGYLEGVTQEGYIEERIKKTILDKLIEAFPYAAEYINQTDDNDELENNDE